MDSKPYVKLAKGSAETRISRALVFNGIYGDLARVGLPIPLVASLQ